MAPRKAPGDTGTGKSKAPKKSRGAARSKETTALVVQKPMKALQPVPSDFPIVGIGASAGGPEAFEQFLDNMPPDSGTAFVMDQASSAAKYDGMPRSAIASGLVDYVLPSERRQEQHLAYIKHPFTREPEKPEEVPSATNFLQKILILVRSRTGHDFSQYKHSTIIRRIERRIAIHEIANMSDYLRYLQKYPEELDTLFKELLIGVTNFFRDREAFDCLKKKVIPLLFEDKSSESSVLRVWVPGCSTGEEAYSLGILLLEHMEQIKREIKVQIFATDIDNSAIETARLGIYPHGIGVDVKPERLRRFFNKQDNAYQVKKSVRDMIVFAVQNVIIDPPFSKLDLISCRNLLIYMGSELQKRPLPLFHYSLHKNGFLFLGTSETVGEFSDLFEPVDRKWKVFRRRETEVPGAIALEITPAALGVNVPVIPAIRLCKPLECFSSQEQPSCAEEPQSTDEELETAKEEQPWGL